MKLIRNEFSKILTKKLSYIILTILLVVIIGYALFVQFSVKSAYGDNWREVLETENAHITETLNSSNMETMNAVGLGDFVSGSLTDSLAMHNYYLENDISPSILNFSVLVDDMRDLAFILFVVSIIVFSGIITDEYEDGKIKLLLLQPRSKWKFIAAKLGTATIINMVLWLFLVMCSMLVGLIFFGTQPAIMVNVIDGIAVQTNTFANLTVQYLSLFISSTCFGIFAFVLANLFKKKALALTFGLVGYFLGGLLKVVLDAFNLKFTQYEFFALIDANNLSSTVSKDVPIVITALLAYLVLLVAASIGLFVRKRRII